MSGSVARNMSGLRISNGNILKPGALVTGDPEDEIRTERSRGQALHLTMNQQTAMSNVRPDPYFSCLCRLCYIIVIVLIILCLRVKFFMGYIWYYAGVKLYSTQK